MSNIIHSFRGYTSFVYRLIFIGIFPPALFILTWFFNDPAYLSWSWVIVFFYITYESIGDYMLFAGICNKENNNYVFLKTSYLGETMFRQVVLADLIRRFVVAAVMGSIAWSIPLVSILLFFLSPGQPAMQGPTKQSTKRPDKSGELHNILSH